MRQLHRADLAFALTTIVLLLLAHAVAYLCHEFSHSVTAWALGYMANPLALDYGHLTPANVVLLSDVGDNVRYGPIMQSGHGTAAALIALAGPYVGNGLLYACICRRARRLAARRRVEAPFLFWLLLMCAGNLWSYVPIRAIATHADIAIAANGLGIGVWALFPVLMVPSLLVAGHFFASICPLLIPAIAARRAARMAMIVTLTTTWFFTFFGGVGLSGSYGAVSQAFSVVSATLLMPTATLWLWLLCTENPSPIAGNESQPTA